MDGGEGISWINKATNDMFRWEFYEVIVILDKIYLRRGKV
jgi:hypothetical protein